MLHTQERYATPCYLLLCGLLVSQTSCIKVTDRILPGPSLRHETGVTSQSPPHAALQFHPDNQGWTVRIAQPVNRGVQVVRSQHEERHYYYWNPLVLPVGLFACPSSAWGWAWMAAFSVLGAEPHVEQRHALRDFTWTSCLMVLMIARSDPKMADVETVIKQRYEPDSRPVTAGRVTLSWHGPREVLVTYPLDDDGRALIRTAHLATALRQEGVPFSAASQGTIDVAAWHQDRVLQRWPLALTAEQLEAAVRLEVPVVAPRTRWPRSLVFRVVIQNVPKALPNPEGLFLRLLVQHGIAVMASDEQQTLVRRELEQNLQGIVVDDGAAGPGHWQAATVLLLLVVHQSADSSRLTVSCLNIRTREVLAIIDVTAGPDGMQGAYDVAVMRFREVLRLSSNSQ